MIQIDTSLQPTTSGSRFNRRNETAHLELYHFFYLFCLFANNWTQCLNVLQNKCMMGNHSNVSHVSPTLINGGILPLWFSWHSLLDFLHLTIIICHWNRQSEVGGFYQKNKSEVGLSGVSYYTYLCTPRLLSSRKLGKQQLIHPGPEAKFLTNLGCPNHGFHSGWDIMTPDYIDKTFSTFNNHTWCARMRKWNMIKK